MTLTRKVDLANQLIPQFAHPRLNSNGAPEFCLPAEAEAEFAQLNMPTFHLAAGMTAACGRLASLVEVADPEVTLSGFRSIREAIEIGQMLRDGVGLLYGLQAASIRWFHEEIARELIANCTRFRMPFQYHPNLPYIAGFRHTDTLLVDQLSATPSANAPMFWDLLDAHPTWSIVLSQTVLQWLASSPATLRSFPWSYQGNAVINHIHPECVESALQLFMTIPSQDTTIRRWTNALRERLR